MMADQASDQKNWNLFARELADILAAYNLSLSQLLDRAGIGSEKVHRLIQSLQTPKRFPTLNPDEMDLVSEKLQFTDVEMLRLQAAILATFIERTLTDYINQNDALLAAEQTFPIILKALQERPSSGRDFGAMREGDGHPLEDDELEMFLSLIQQPLDDADRALQMSYLVTVKAEQIDRARAASSGYKEALLRLQNVDDYMRGLQLWHEYYVTCQKGLACARERLEDLGA